MLGKEETPRTSATANQKEIKCSLLRRKKRKEHHGEKVRGTLAIMLKLIGKKRGKRVRQ